MKGKRRTWERVLAIVLCLTMLFSQSVAASATDFSLPEKDTSGLEIQGTTANPIGDNTGDDNTPGDETGNTDGKPIAKSGTEDQTDGKDQTGDNDDTNETDKNEIETDKKDTNKEETGDDAKDDSDIPEELDISLYYKDGKICLYNYNQVLLIGTDTVVCSGDKDGDIGSGEIIKVDGQALTYGNNSQYYLMNDIQVDTTNIWTVPEGFTGSISPLETPEARSEKVYDAKTDTIYIYNPYQLLTLDMDTSDEEIVMSLDYEASKFGMGQVITPEGSEDFLTYSKTHNYVISTEFTTDMPELEANQVNLLAAGMPTEGRDFNGQVIKNVGGTEYILIGNEDQLRAIGTNVEVRTAVYQATYYAFQGWRYDTDSNGNPIMLYGGDADLKSTQNGTKDYGFQSIDDAQYTIGVTRGRCGVVQIATGTFAAGDINPDLSIEDAAYNHTYSITENYIIFRDINLKEGETSNGSDDLWTPLTFSGTMIGAKSVNGEDIGTADGTFTALGKPVISNIGVYLSSTTQIEVNEYIGVGFFATITNEVNVNDVGVSAGTVSVSNIELNNVTIQNNATEAHETQTLVNALTTSLGWLVGSLVDFLTFILTFGQAGTDLSTFLSSLLNARANDPTIFATGSFAGRIVGDVEVSNCSVTGDVTVTNVNDRTGGFVGYSEGVTQYDGLSDALHFTTDFLASLLNIIPGLGLGDLITILLDNTVDLDSLIPTGYKNAKITGCTVEGLHGTLGSSGKSYAGGFIGAQIGTIIQNCSVQNSTNQLQGSDYIGGFAGLCRDAEIHGTLTEVGIDLNLLRIMQPQSMLLNCSINNSTMDIGGINYVGGFIGAQANSYAINCTITGNHTVRATGNYAGGFSGIATVGWVANLGAAEEASSSTNLLKVVGQLLVDLLSSNPEKAGMLLSLTGVAPSAILGCQINGTAISISAQGNYAGGIIGAGDGVIIAESSQAILGELSYWKYNSAHVDGITVVERTNTLTGLQNVHAEGNRAGGIAGSVTTASITGLLNNTLGLGEFLGFTIHNVSVDGIDSGYRITATGNYAGGAFGEAVGGDIQNVALTKIQTVSANNRVGGFVGCAGPGDFAGADGLSLNLLGLNNLLKISNLLSIGEGILTTVNKATVEGIADGFTVEATGTNNAGEVAEYVAGGFIGFADSVDITDATVTNLLEAKASITSGSAGGFVGASSTGGLAEVSDETSIEAIIDAGPLLDAVAYLIPSYKKTTVTYVDGGGVSANEAGGFAGDFQSGIVDNQENGEGNYYAVYNLDYVKGGNYGGGFGGKVYSGALASSTGGISILGGINGLNINVADLLSVINAYIPELKYAGVKSDNGFTVEANTLNDMDANSASAGGYIGYGSGVQISYCDVTQLKHTTVKPPDDLEAVDAPSYFDTESSYAISGGRYAGGYIGYMNIGSAASVGGGLQVLGSSLGLTNILDALNVVVSTIEHSQVTGGPGGFAVLASANATSGNPLGHAGGFAGQISGGHIQDSNAYNFSYVIGQITAGGYVGDLVPGNVANVLNDTSILQGLVNVSDSLASVAEDFVPTIRNSSTTCIPCGGAVRAQAASSSTIQRGLAGGYVGHNEGGSIWGLNTDRWKTEPTYTGPTSICKALRIGSVYGAEIAGGFSGLMECADTASTGSLSLLWGLVEVNNLLGALSIVYPTEENTAVHGPLAEMQWENWNSWVDFIGKYGGYGSDLAQNGTVDSQEALDAILSKYIYGYEVCAGRTTYGTGNHIAIGGVAGGYVGSMRSGVVTNGQAHDTKAVQAMRTAGGFAGEMINNGAASLGEVNILGLNLNLGNMLDIIDVFVPVVKVSSVEGYQTGLSVSSTGTDITHDCGYAGGYVGYMSGGQIWGDETSVAQNQSGGCNITKLRSVKGKNCIGGYVGKATAGTVASANTNAGSGLLQGILNLLISTPNSLLSVLDATVSTIRGASVSAVNADWGYTVDGSYTNNGTRQYAQSAGGFAGTLEAAVLGDRDGASTLKVENLRGVIGGLYAGGFFGLADVSSAASVSGNDTSSGTTTILGLIQAGEVSVLDAFRSYIYHADVNGVSDGITVHAYRQDKEGILDSTRYTGNAGGFGGGLLNGSVKDSTVTNLSSVIGLNYAGGFIGHLGKNGTLDVDNAEVLQQLNLLGATAGILDVFGSHVENSSVSGATGGCTVKATGGEDEKAGGFTGYSDLSRLNNCSVTNLRLVTSDLTAGGFIGETEMNYIANTQVNSVLLNVLLKIVNELVKLLYLDKAQDLGLIDLGIGGLLGLKVLSDGDLLYVNLLGLRIGVSLSKASETGETTDVATITIGDSTIKLPCSNDGLISQDTANLEITLIKGNRSNIIDCLVTGTNIGYKVFGAGASEETDGSGRDAYSGGFIGLNNEGLFENNKMVLCDVVRGASNNVGPFSGKTNLESVYYFNSVKGIEGDGNQYSVYRTLNMALKDALKPQTTTRAVSYELISEAQEDTTTSTAYNRYDVQHLATINSYEDFEEAVMAEDTAGTNAQPLGVYESPAKAVLMSDNVLLENNGTTTPEPSEMQDPCEETIELTIQKKWRDFSNVFGLRPESITVYINRSYVKGTETINERLPEPVILSAAEDASTWTDTWSKVVSGLPVAFKETDAGGTEQIYYYTYSIEEEAVPEYTTTIDVSEDGYTFTITNTHFGILPDTGGGGIYLFIILGFAILLFMLYTGYRKRKKRFMRGGSDTS